MSESAYLIHLIIFNNLQKRVFKNNYLSLDGFIMAVEKCITEWCNRPSQSFLIFFYKFIHVHYIPLYFLYFFGYFADQNVFPSA